MKRNGETILNEWLVINCQIGDEQALEQLLKIWYPKLKGYAHRFIYDESLIDDVVQNTLMDMSKTLTKLKDPAAFPKWIYQILQFKCVDAIRTQTKHRKIQQVVNDENQLFSQQTSEVEQETKINLDELDVESQKLLYFYYYEEFSLSEISQILSTPTGTLKSRLFNIRHKLRNSYNGDDDE
jgi:RNA polymerase sigma-70 factor (ECF subfamily)